MVSQIKLKDPWLSVIVPSHNGERWLANALQSLVDQKDRGIEIILIDSSAADASLELASGFADKLDLRVHRRLDLLAWPAKVNFGVEQARADWFCILHQDDLWLPNRSVKLRSWLVRQPDCVMHLHAAYIIDERGRKLGRWRCPLPRRDAPVPADRFCERLLVQNFIPIPAPAIRRDAYSQVGGMDETLWYTADWDLYLKLSRAGDVWYHSDRLVCFRVHKNSLTVTGSTSIDDFRKQQEIVRDRHAAAVSGKSPRSILPLASASIDINTALAAANSGKPGHLARALWSLLRLGPRGVGRYVYYSRIVDRLVPRLRARFAGGL